MSSEESKKDTISLTTRTTSESQFKPPKRPESASSTTSQKNPSPYVTVRKTQPSSVSKPKKELKKEIPLPPSRPATVASSVSKSSMSSIPVLPKRPETAKPETPAQHITVRRAQSSSLVSNPSVTSEAPESSENPKTPVKVSRSHSAISGRKRQYVINNNVYIEITRIGKGGSSQVFQCFSNTYGCMVAVKIVDLEYEPKEVKEGFINEVRLLKKLQGSKHVIKLFDQYVFISILIYIFILFSVLSMMTSSMLSLNKVKRISYLT